MEDCVVGLPTRAYVGKLEFATRLDVTRSFCASKHTCKDKNEETRYHYLRELSCRHANDLLPRALTYRKHAF